MKSIYKIMKYGLPNWLNKLTLKMRNNEVGESFTSYGRIFIRGKGKISIGNNVTITSCRDTNPIGGDIKTILYAKTGSSIIIGNNVRFI